MGKKTRNAIKFYGIIFFICLVAFLIGLYIGAKVGLDQCINIANSIAKKYFDISLTPDGLAFLKNYKLQQYLT